ncbi:MAG TPA: outer membrane beta-barrel protein [Xanthobacteraceae bacterium]|nr:outer membrane beta-barrel protein [Xanthobacteraceae bacterium]
MRRVGVGGLVIALLIVSALGDGAQAAKKRAKAAEPEPPSLPPAVHNWSGFYTGVNAGIAWGSFTPVTSTIPGGVTGVIGAATTPLFNAAGHQAGDPFGFGGGVQGGYNWQSGHWLAGIEGDIEYLHLNFPARTYVQFAGNTNTAVMNAYDNANWIATLRPRLGWAEGDWLFYLTGGPAVTKYDDDFSIWVVNEFGGDQFSQAAGLRAWRLGYAAGGGVERAIGNNWSVRAEYLHFDFGRATATQVQSTNLVQLITQSAELKADMVRLGLNYRFGGMDAAAASPQLFDSAEQASSIWNAANWEFDVGARAFFGNGLDGESNPLGGTPTNPTNVVVSRLQWSNLNSLAGETYARLDHASGFFVKGYLGAGGLFNGVLHDEDFPADHAYSNTYSTVAGSMGYVTADAGYTFLKAPGAKLGAFVGYNFFSEQMISHGCSQVAGDDICAPPDPATQLLLSQDIQFNSLRVGLSSQFMLTDRLKFVADAAYVPVVSAVAVDDHNATASYFPESASGGYGTMMEAFFSYDVTPHWNVGVGGRYWAWNMRQGTDESITKTLGQGVPAPEFDAYNTDRYGVFVQSGYHWGDTTRPADAAANSVAELKPMNWSGVYLGGHLGGAWSDARWSDPFGPTPGTHGAENVPGFGDLTQAHGPLGGGQVGMDWQTGPGNGSWVLGVQADGDFATIRGDNTCFSGLGGVNCEHQVNALATLTGRAGFAWGRSLFYVKGGGALASTDYNLNGNTNGSLTLGLGTTTIDKFGWTAGLGLEYAITDHWTTSFEYDHIELGDVTVPFPSVAIVAGNHIGVTQWVDTLKLGVNYRFNWFEPTAAVN